MVSEIMIEHQNQALANALAPNANLTNLRDPNQLEEAIKRLELALPESTPEQNSGQNLRMEISQLVKQEVSQLVQQPSNLMDRPAFSMLRAAAEAQKQATHASAPNNARISKPTAGKQAPASAPQRLNAQMAPTKNCKPAALSGPDQKRPPSAQTLQAQAIAARQTQPQVQWLDPDLFGENASAHQPSENSHGEMAVEKAVPKAAPKKTPKPRPTTPRINTTEDRFEVEESLVHMYPQLEMRDFLPWQLWNGPLIPDFLIQATDPAAIERIVVVGCGDGILANTLSLLFPGIQVVGVDSSKARIKRARLTIGDRTNIQFIHGHAAAMEPIQCDRIIYDNCVGRFQNKEDFKTLVSRTLRWLKPNGDFIVKESPLKLAKSLLFIQQAWSRLWEKPSIEHYLRSVMIDVGFANPITYRYQRMPWLATELYYQSPRSLTLTGMMSARKENKIAEWKGATEQQSFDSVVGFLFNNQEADFSGDFA